MDENSNQESPKPGHSGFKGLVTVLAILIVAAGIYAVSKNRNQPAVENNQQEKSTNQSPAAETQPTAPETSPDSQAPAVKSFSLEGENFKFSLSEIRVKKGDKVKIVFTNKSGTHDWVIDEFNAKTPQIQSGQTAEVEFIADKVGTFEYYCNVGQHRQMGMKGNLIVEE